DASAAPTVNAASPSAGLASAGPITAMIGARTAKRLVSFEELHGAFVPLGGSTRCERPEIAAFPGLGILLSRVQAVAARCQLSNHRRGRTRDRTTRGCTLHGRVAIPERPTASGSESSSCWKFRNARSSSRGVGIDDFARN